MFADIVKDTVKDTVKDIVKDTVKDMVECFDSDSVRGSYGDEG